MKSCFIAIFIAMFLVLPSRAYNNGSIRVLNTYVTDSSSTNVTVLPAKSGVQYTIYGFDLSLSSADSMLIECNSTVRLGYYLAATSGLARTYYPMHVRCNIGDPVVLVKGNASTPIRMTLWYSTDNL